MRAVFGLRRGFRWHRRAGWGGAGQGAERGRVPGAVRDRGAVPPGPVRDALARRARPAPPSAIAAFRAEGHKLFQCNRCKKQVRLTAAVASRTANSARDVVRGDLPPDPEQGRDQLGQAGRRCGVKQATAWLLKHKLMQAMAGREAQKPSWPGVEFDEIRCGASASRAPRSPTFCRTSAASSTTCASSVVPHGPVQPRPAPDLLQHRVQPAEPAESMGSWVSYGLGFRATRPAGVRRHVHRVRHQRRGGQLVERFLAQRLHRRPVPQHRRPDPERVEPGLIRAFGHGRPDRPAQQETPGRRRRPGDRHSDRVLRDGLPAPDQRRN